MEAMPCNELIILRGGSGWLAATVVPSMSRRLGDDTKPIRFRSSQWKEQKEH